MPSAVSCVQMIGQIIYFTSTSILPALAFDVHSVADDGVRPSEAQCFCFSARTAAAAHQNNSVALLKLTHQATCRLTSSQQRI